MSLNTASNSQPRGMRLTLPVLGVVLLVVAGACVAATAAYFEVRPSPAVAGDITVTDDLGRTVSVPVDPHRIAVLSPNLLDTVYRLGLRSDVVGVDCESPTDGGLSGDYSTDQIQAWNLSSSLCIQVAPSFDIEELIASEPQLVLASTIISLSDIEEVQTTYHIPVVVLAPATVGGIVTDVQIVSGVFGDPARTQPLVASLQSELGNATTLANSLLDNGTALPTVLLTYYANPSGSSDPGYYTYGPGTFGQSLVELAGGSSISANATIAYPLLSGPQVLYANPAVIVYGTGFGLDLSEYQSGPDWGELSAVTSGHVYGIDSNLVTEADPTMILSGLPALTGELHPVA